MGPPKPITQGNMNFSCFEFKRLFNRMFRSKFFFLLIPVLIFIHITMDIVVDGSKVNNVPQYLWKENNSASHRSLMKFDEGISTFSTTSKGVKTVADVEGSNMDHNGSISNTCLTKVSLVQMSFMEMPAPSFSFVGMRSFILRSSYRIDSRTFVTLGLSPLSLHSLKISKPGVCFWIDAKGNMINGNLHIIWPGEHHELMYESIIYRCQLERNADNGSGGALYLTIDEEQVPVYKEAPSWSLMKKNAKPKYKISVCSFPLYRDINPTRILEWIQYMYNNLGVEYFLLNDGGSVDEEMIEVLMPFIRAGVVEVNDIRGEFKYETKHNVLTLNDCLYSLRFKSQWLLFLDFDEYLHVESPKSLSSLLDENKNAPFITFGSLWWSVSICKSPLNKGDWAIEKMQFHWPHMYCVEMERGHTYEKCLNYFGHRKFIVNPRKVWTVEVHRPIDPIDTGVHLNTSIARINHFQGLARNSLQTCTEISTEKLEWWNESDHLAKLASRAKKLGTPKILKRIFS